MSEYEPRPTSSTTFEIARKYFDEPNVAFQKLEEHANRIGAKVSVHETYNREDPGNSGVFGLNGKGELIIDIYTKDLIGVTQTKDLSPQMVAWELFHELHLLEATVDVVNNPKKNFLGKLKSSIPNQLAERFAMLEEQDIVMLERLPNNEPNKEKMLRSRKDLLAVTRTGKARNAEIGEAKRLLSKIGHVYE